MTDLNLNISTEDGQLLSKLVNDLAQVQYGIDHIVEMNLDWIVVVCVLTGLVCVMIIGMLCTGHDFNRLGSVLMILCAVIVIAALVAGAYFAIVYYLQHIDVLSLEMEAEGLKAQIEVLLSKYGMTWADLPSFGVNI